MESKTGQIRANSLWVTVRNPERILYQGAAVAVSSVNEKGPFDVLPEHENFISVISQKLTIHLPNGQSQEIPTSDGIIKVLEGRVIILLGILELTEKEK